MSKGKKVLKEQELKFKKVGWNYKHFTVSLNSDTQTKLGNIGTGNIIESEKIKL